MKVVAVCVGKAEQIGTDDTWITGIFKKPVTKPVWINKLGLTNDNNIALERYDLADREVYVFGSADYTWWHKKLGRKLEHGSFGENLCIDGLDSQDVFSGDKLHFNHVVLEVTMPRTPCKTLATRMGNKQFGKLFMASRHPGFYCRVIKTGYIKTGETVNRKHDVISTVKVIDWPTTAK